MPRRQDTTVILTCPRYLDSIRESIVEKDLMPCGTTVSDKSGPDSLGTASGLRGLVLGLGVTHHCDSRVSLRVRRCVATPMPKARIAPSLLVGNGLALRLSRP